MNKHPDNNLLEAYASGSIDAVSGLVVATHLENCSKCRAYVNQLEAAQADAVVDDIWPSEYYPPDLVDHYSPEQDMLKEQVVKFLEILPKNQRDVLRAVYLEELPHQQVAEMFEIPLGTVKSRLRLAVEKLRHSMHTEQL